MKFSQLKKKKTAVLIIVAPLGCLLLGVCLLILGKTALFVMGGWFFGLIQVVIAMGICAGMFFLSRWQTGWRWVAVPAVIGVVIAGVIFGWDFLIGPWSPSSAKPEKKETKTAVETKDAEITYRIFWKSEKGRQEEFLVGSPNSRVELVSYGRHSEFLSLLELSRRPEFSANEIKLWSSDGKKFIKGVILFPSKEASIPGWFQRNWVWLAVGFGVLAAGGVFNLVFFLLERRRKRKFIPAKVV